ncbi:MAG: multi-copper polyphenol oxidoreductase [Deltaproteobacteria bacterium]|nr:multi-copper polyphenol oxidoreductase [Deltaproteobacteria bacterium]
MTDHTPEALCDPVLMVAGLPHGFGQRGGGHVPENTTFPVQVHGIAVAEASADRRVENEEADAVVCAVPGRSVGIVTADCLPILAAGADGSAVLAIHAGWRGLAAGVIEAGIRALRTRSQTAELVAALGPAARGCCYEVDGPVEAALAERYSADLEGVLVPGRPGRHQLDLPLLAARILAGLGVEPTRIGTAHRVCTICDADRFESYRREGASAGRLRHFISLPAGSSRQG